jgi:hypothetical protein
MTFADFVYDTIVPMIDAVVVPFLYALAFLFFLYGVFKYFFSESDEKRKEGRTFALWGVIALAVMFSVWGLVRVLLASFF